MESLIRNVLAFVIIASIGGVSSTAHADLVLLEVTEHIAPGSSQHSMGIRSDGTIVIGGVSENTQSATPRILQVDSNLRSMNAVDVSNLAGLPSYVGQVSRNGEWFTIAALDDVQDRYRAGRGQVSSPNDLDEIANPWSTYWYFPHAIGNDGEFFGSVGHNISGVRASVGEQLTGFSSTVPFAAYDVSDGGNVMVGLGYNPSDQITPHREAVVNGASLSNIQHLTDFPHSVSPEYFKPPETSPSGRLITAQRWRLELDEEFNVLSYLEAAYYRDNDGIVTNDQLSTDYELIYIIDSLTNLRYNGWASAITEEWIGGEFFIGQDGNQEAWLMNLSDGSDPILIRDLLAEAGIFAPTSLRATSDLRVGPDGKLVALIQGGEGRWFLMKDVTAVPEPSHFGLLACIMSIFVASRRNKGVSHI